MTSPGHRPPARRLATLALAAVAAAGQTLAGSGPVDAGAGIRHPYALAQPAQAPAEALLVVEIPAGGAIKYEIGADGLVFVDRFLSMPVAYPANYGSLPGTLAGDCDPLDALVLTRAPLHPGVLLRFRPLGVLRMVDGGETDEKLVGVPLDGIDPAWTDVRALDELPAMERRRIEAFFRVYKDLPESGEPVALHGWGDTRAAQRVLRDAIARAGDPQAASACR
ncbi:inorganic diphosphatase [Luteimonas sp. RD2P54]|uniref:Inorganic pyrophosphatase n=1 Tax=Luteimonas endophytica TaxID=3042023 RepID=A0ABT6JBU6_9GAMM|nr:inorganic diphosphatase [Luteimonas endophytica]MDH5824298.1 inorganic diphosphatase [Luteimonas endophytica]